MKDVVRRILLACGILSPVIYIAGDVVLCMKYEGYSYLHQTVSELNAIGAPTRGLSIVLGLADYGLLVSFGVGIGLSAAGNRKLRVVAGALVALGAFGVWGVPYASMQMPGAEQGWLHPFSGAVGALLVITAIGFAAAAFGWRFRCCSIATIVVMVVFAGWAVMDASRIEASLAIPWVGVKERISFYGWHLWFSVLALVLLRQGNSEPVRAAP